MIRGSCLCGGVRFEYGRPRGGVGMCHCSQCRKVSGTASNAVIVVPEAELRWLAGEELRRSRAAGTPRSAASAAARVPQLLPAGGAYWVPAGALDDDPGPRIAGHIYVGSRASWDEIAGDAPRFEAGLPARK